MTYAVWLVLEDEDTGDKRWWSVDHMSDEQTAESVVDDIVDAIYSQTGSEPQELDR